MKKSLLVIISLIICLFTVQPGSGEEWDDLRNHEVILFTGQSIRQFESTPIDQIFIYAYRQSDNSWRQITFQIDELDGNFGYFNKNYNNTLDLIDEFVFLAGDAGDFAPTTSWINDEESRQHVRYQIEITNPDDPLTNKYVYIYRSSVLIHDPGLPYYIKYIAPVSGASDTVKTATYIEGHNSKGISDCWRIADSSGVYGPNILDRQKARAKGKYKYEIIGIPIYVDYDLNEDNLIAERLDYKRGPVRIIRDVTYKARISEFDISVGTFRYRYYPYRIVALGADKILDSDYGVSLIRQSFDLSSDAGGMLFDNPDNFDVVVDGNEDSVNTTIQRSPEINWYMYSGNPGTVVVLNEFTPPSNANYRLYYYENRFGGTADGTSDTGDNQSYGDVGIWFQGDKMTGGISLPYFNYFLPGHLSREIGSTLAYQTQNRLSKFSSLQSYISPAEVAIFLPDTSGPEQYHISIPVLVEELTELNVLSSQLVIQFDPQVLEFTDVATMNTLVENWDQPIVTISSDTIYLTMEGTTALQGGGVLVYLNFNTIGIEDQQSPLHFIQARFNLWNPLAKTTNGNFTTLPAPKIMVSIPDTYGSVNSEVTVPIQIEDVTGLNITSCLIELQHNKRILDAISITNEGSIASEWNDISFSDKIGWLKIEMSGANPLTGSGTLVWLNFKVIGSPGQDTDIVFNTMVFNDGMPLAKTENGYFTVKSPLLIDVLVSISDTTIESLNSLHIPVMLSSSGGFKLYHYDMDLVFDENILEFKDTDTTATIAKGWGYPLVRNLHGNLSIIANGEVPLKGDGPLIFLNFDVIGSDSSNTTIHFSNMTFNRGEYSASTQDGIIYVKGVVPVELSSFTAITTDNNVKLEWVTTTESNNYGFFIQRTADTNSKWKTIGFVPGNGTATTPQGYSYTDSDVIPGIWYYRLQQQDFEGQVTYSLIIEVNLLPAKFSLYQNYPNPFNSSTIIKYELPAGKHDVQLIVFDLLGHQICKLINEEKQRAGVCQVSWNGRDNNGVAVASGVYFYQLQAGNQTFIKKMVLIE